MEILNITGQQRLQGEFHIAGSKNAATKILVASILTAQQCHIRNVPDIEDVHRIIELLQSLGVKVQWSARHELQIHAETVTPETIDSSVVRKLRASVLFFGALVGRCRAARLPGPGGDTIGARPLDAHLDVLRSLGISIENTGDEFILQQTNRGAIEFTMPEFSVTATENAILASVLGANHRTTIHCAATDPSVQELCWFLATMGALISGIGTSSLTITGVQSLQGCDGYDIMPDPVETGTLLCLAAASRSTLELLGASPTFLRSELRKFNDTGIPIELVNQRKSVNGNYLLADLKVSPANKIQALRKLHNMPYPGFNPDLLPPFTVLLTQAEGTSLVQDWMYEGRLKYVEELNKMGADIFVADPHRILVTGPRNLDGATISNYDIRTGASLLVASLIASGQSSIAPAYQLDRGYEHLDERLQSIGAKIERVKQ